MQNCRTARNDSEVLVDFLLMRLSYPVTSPSTTMQANPSGHHEAKQTQITKFAIALPQATRKSRLPSDSALLMVNFALVEGSMSAS